MIGELAFDAAHRLFHVVGDGLGEIPERAGNLFQLAVHGGDQLIFVLVEDGPPLLLRFQVDEVFGVEEAGGVGAIVGTADLADDLRSLPGTTARITRAWFTTRVPSARTGAGRDVPRAQIGAFVQMRQKFGTDRPAGR